MFKNLAMIYGHKMCAHTHVSSTLVLGEVRSPVELALVVRHVGLTGDGRGSAVRQRASHLRVLGLLHRAVHAVELRST